MLARPASSSASARDELVALRAQLNAREKLLMIREKNNAKNLQVLSP